MTMIHLFQDAGLGKAPFKLIGKYSIPSASLAEHNPSGYQNALNGMPKDVGVGSCAYCGTALVHNFIIQSSCGKKSAVGCDCVAKTSDKGLVNAIKLLKRRLNQEKRADERNKKHEAMIAAQREKNSGLTDYEMNQKIQLEAKEKRENSLEAVRVLLAPFIDALAKNPQSSFCCDVHAFLSEGEMDVSANVARIIKDITAKEAGRANSKKYAARYDELEDIWMEAEALFKTIP